MFYSDMIKKFRDDARNSDELEAANDLHNEMLSVAELQKLYNATAYRQHDGPAFVGFGFNVEIEPRVQRVDASDLEKEGLRVAASIPANSDVLIGGALLLIEAAPLDLLQKGCRLWAALTERETAPDGSFVFKLCGVSETPLSKWWHENDPYKNALLSVLDIAKNML